MLLVVFFSASKGSNLSTTQRSAKLHFMSFEDCSNTQNWCTESCCRDDHIGGLPSVGRDQHDHVMFFLISWHQKLVLKKGERIGKQTHSITSWSSPILQHLGLQCIVVCWMKLALHLLSCHLIFIQKAVVWSFLNEGFQHEHDWIKAQLLFFNFEELQLCTTFVLRSVLCPHHCYTWGVPTNNHICTTFCFILSCWQSGSIVVWKRSEPVFDCDKGHGMRQSSMKMHICITENN